MRSAFWRLLALATIVVTGLVAVPSAGANVSNMSVQVGNGKLVAGVYAVVPVTYSCLADEASLPFNQAWVDVIVWENTPDGIVSGGGSFGGITCDGNTHTQTAHVFPSDSSPLKPGKAVGLAEFYVYDVYWQFFSVSSGYTTIRITGGK